MTSYNDLIFKYKKDFNGETNILRKYLFELCNDEGIDLYYDKDNECPKKLQDIFEAGIIRLKNGEPLNYVLGYSYFFGYKMIVTDKVLIPRFETEELVSHVLACCDNCFKNKKIDICDIGTGSGAIAIALKKEEDDLNIYATDISNDALNVAKENAKLNKCNINFLSGNMLDPLIEKDIHVDIIVSNPPYIKTIEDVENSVFDFEPHIALFGGEDGLMYYKELLSKAKLVLKDNGYIFFEMGYDQKVALSDLVRNYLKDAKIEVFKDINNKNRFMKICV